jgi:subfamily B ATP-binding cassette protein MsbA
MEEYERKRFAKENESYFRTYIKGVKLKISSSPLIQLFGYAGVILVLWYGGHLVVIGELNPEDLIAFALYLTTISAPIKKLARINLNIQQASSASQRIFEILDTEDYIVEEPNRIKLSIKGEVEFDNVSFSYGGERVLKEINLKIREGEVLAIVGPSGGGKSTLVNLIPRAYDPSKGVVRIDGFDVKKLDLKTLRAQIGVVPQDVIMFNGTIRENIAYGRKDASIEEIISAAKAANAHNFIIALPGEYEFQVGDCGRKLSSGERQRVSIARAILRKPKILILDEATSLLDAESEELIQQALSKIMRNQTTIIIAHRLSTILHSDRIIVIDGGQIREEGTHEELLKRGGMYKKLYEMQFRV